jgi:IclR family transcriptional regulator, KDG regulon repressor
MAAKRCLVPAVKRAFEIIELLSSRDGGVTISELHRELKLPVSSVANLLYTLADLGYLDRDAAGTRYSLSVRFLALGRHVLDGIDLTAWCHPLLEELAGKTGLAAHLAVRHEGESVYVDRIAARGLVQITSYVGMRWPVHVSAAGKALLAFLPEPQLESVLKKYKFAKLTPQTVVSPPAFRKQLDEIQQRGYSIEFGEGEVGVACVAAPIFGPQEVVVAAVSLSGTIFQLPRPEIPRLGELVKHYGRLMSNRLNGSLETDAVPVARRTKRSSTRLPA